MLCNTHLVWIYAEHIPATLLVEWYSFFVINILTFLNIRKIIICRSPTYMHRHFCALSLAHSNLQYLHRYIEWTIPKNLCLQVNWHFYLVTVFQRPNVLVSFSLSHQNLNLSEDSGFKKYEINMEKYCLKTLINYALLMYIH